MEHFIRCPFDHRIDRFLIDRLPFETHGALDESDKLSRLAGRLVLLHPS